MVQIMAGSSTHFGSKAKRDTQYHDLQIICRFLNISAHSATICCKSRITQVADKQ